MRSFVIAITLALFSSPVLAQQTPASSPHQGANAGTANLPVVASGVVPDQATKAAILERLRAIYGNERVVDSIDVKAVPVPPNWDKYVINMLTPRLKQVSEGRLDVNGQTVSIIGNVPDEVQKQQVGSSLSLASNNSYTVTNNLQVQARGPSAQVRINQILDRRTVEFETGKASLTPVGVRILDEVVAIIREEGTGNSRILITGHTDSVGNRESNYLLSQARANTVRDYLVSNGIAGDRLSTVGRGPDEPIADNATADGRARNRRITFTLM
ncbi:MAG: OmpA family protein [Xanthomonadaceae bacterium]|jgi:OOP family OmpA-OmpF porin|nr:OmpA family protein [Xanthomonadaceae bacterium]